MARSILRCLLRDLKAKTRGMCDITVITGRGKGSKGEAVLPQETRSFLASASGPLVTEVPANPGCFLLTEEHLLIWAEGSS